VSKFTLPIQIQTLTHKHVPQVNYLRQYGELIEKHYRRTVLNHLPKEAWKKLDEPEMIDSPNLEEFVFCRVLEPIQIDVSGDAGDNEEGGEDLIDTIQEHGAGSCLIVMYKSIREFVLDGKVELLM
jgi:GINS complex subunit 4